MTSAAPPRNRSRPLVELRRVGRAYGSGQGRVEALRNVDLVINQGEFVAIVGPSGSGKSTCLNILGCLDAPTSGTLSIDGRQVADLGAEERARVRRDVIGFVFQGSNLIAGMSAQRNVELPLVYRGVSAGERAKRARTALASVGLADRAHHTPGELSGGQQQRVAIARAIVGRPRLLIADEPTGALDSRTGQSIMTLLTDLGRTMGTTIVLVTHDRAIAAAAPRIVTFRDGVIVEDSRQRHYRHAG